ncbi:MAG: ABC transporter permease [Terriglobales bacterium]
MRDGLAGDWQEAARSFRRRPGGALAIVVLLALGVGAPTMLVAPVHALLLAPLALPRPSQLVRIRLTGLPGGGVYDVFTNRFPHRRALSAVFSHVAAYWDAGAGSGTAVVTPGFFATAGVSPRLGRVAAAGASAADSAIVSDRIWRSRLAAKTDLTGLTVSVDGRRYRVAGVMPPGFEFPSGTSVWLPAQSAPIHVIVFGRLRAGLSRQAAEVRLRSLAAEGRLGARRAPRLQPLGDYISGSRGTLALQLWLLALLFFLLACAGAGYLLWARAADQEVELRIRSALGAGPWRLARLAMAEPLCLAAAGGGLGLVLAWQGSRLLPSLAPRLGNAVPSVIPLSWVCAAVLAVAAVVLCGCPGALRAVGARMDSSAAPLRAPLRRRGPRWLANPRQWVQAAQLALAMVLLVAAGLLWRSLQARLQMPLGFNPSGVMLLRVNLPPLPGAARAAADFQRRRHRDPALQPAQDAELMAAVRAEAMRNERFYGRASRALAALPGVVAVGSI